MSGAAQVERSRMQRASLQKQEVKMTRSMVLTRGLLLFVLIQCISPRSLYSLAAPVRKLDSSSSSFGLIDLQTTKGLATILPLKWRDANFSRSYIERKRRRLLGESHMPLHDDLLTKGYFTSSLFVGTPAKEFSLIVDTGSTITYVPCSTCTHCGPNHQDAAFGPANSSSYEVIPCTSTICNTGLCGPNKQCKYERQYAESSTSAGILGKDLIGFGDNSTIGSPRLLFGCENVETGDLFSQQADGIMGLGRGSLSIVDQLVQEKDMADTFSLCYAGMDEQGGNMVMGDLPHPPGMVFTASDPKRSPYYNIVLKKIKVAGTALPVDPGVFNARYGTVLDSGTTYAYLPEKAFNEFKGAILAQVPNLKPVSGPDADFQDICFAGADNDPQTLSKYFPAVELEFGDGLSLPLEPENYLFKHTRIPGAYCLGIFKNGNDHTTLLGAILVRNVLVRYDRANNRIGFWRTKCTDLWTHYEAAMSNKDPPPPPPPPPSPPPPPPPVKEEIAAEPPSNVPEEPSRIGPITDEHIGALELNISVTANYTTFSTLSAAFLEDMVRDLELEPHQVKLLGFEDQGSDVAVSCAVSPASAMSPLPGRTVENIIGRLKQHRVQLRNDFGSYHLTNWRLIPQRRSSDNIGLVLSMVVLAVVLVSGGLAYWSYRKKRDRTQNVKYVTVDPMGYNASEQL